MAVLYPLVLVGAGYVLFKSRKRGLGVRGLFWSVAWAVAGAAFMFSFVTGLSIGLYLFPAATFGIFWLALNAPYGRELSGFPVGIGAVLLGLLFA